ncbi:MAG: hypothetical protein A2571_03225 [Candidatus Vogelbacteria bacterium RIFOXYD1_FULL_44_32]|uniref:glycerol kinase n=1 Tax=Candidatus Vogelbacteria bacterium RIFOXYD1_FULL_44_32 TaxID=1802438 RepID=A0A1G2QE39_9BACT|nr:MAG: hypothetical protein A2571_03225 [Candidatus Vogelbacteria bacterium RIFOXYD1_FULL_44_32]
MFLKIFSRGSKSKQKKFLVLDVGTTGVKGIVFADDGTVLAKSYRFLKKNHPKKGWVEQDPMEMVSASIFVLRNALDLAKLTATDITACGITNQRETTILWDKNTGLPVCPAIVWEDNRTKDWCDDLAQKHGPLVREKTGLLIEPYFSASKIRWILKNSAQAEKLKREGNLLFGTVDSWILWNLSDEAVHATDYTNASRTLLYDIKEKKWNSELLEIFSIPSNILPQVLDSAGRFGSLRRDIVSGEIPIGAIIGDQEASAVAAALERGVTKVTYGTGAFIAQGLGQNFELHDGFYTTLVPGLYGPEYMLEAKVSGYGDQVGKYLKDPVKLKEVLESLTKEVGQVLERLPLPVSKVMADGGITQAEFLLAEQERVSGIKMVKQKIYDGTSLGVLYLLQDFLKQPKV